MTTPTPRLPADADVRAAVSALLDADDVTAVRDVDATHLGGQAHEGTLGVHRLTGVAETALGEKPFEIVVKHVSPAGHERLAAQVRREVSAYADPDLAEIADEVRPAHCYHQASSPEGEHWLFLESLHHAPVVPWNAESYVEASAALGRFHARGTKQSLTGDHWTDRCAFHNYCYVPEIAAEIDALAGAIDSDPGHPLGSDAARTFVRMWRKRDVLFDCLKRLPRTLSHGDFHNENVFLSIGRHGKREWVAIDWAYAGPGGLGEDAGTLLGADICFRRMTNEVFMDLVPRVFDGYLRGLRAAGWNDDVRLPGLGFAAYGGFDAGLRLLVDGGRNPVLSADTNARLAVMAPMLHETAALAWELFHVDLS